MTSPRVIAAGAPATAAAGADRLRAGGSAVDAAVGAMLAAFVAEPVLTGPFGGGFATVGGTGVAPATWDFFADVPGRGLPPASAQPGLDFVGLEVDFGATTQTFHVGRGAAAVPLILPGLVALHAAHGTLPLSSVVQPAVNLARSGVALSGGVWTFVKILEPILMLTPESRRIFAPNGRLLAAGDRMVNAELGDLLEALGTGAAAPAADALLSAFGPPVGRISAEDLLARRVEARPPVHVSVGAFDVLLNPPPSSGGLLVAFGLRLLEGVPESLWRDELAAASHLVAAMALMNAVRARVLADGAPIDPLRFLGDAHLDSWRDAFRVAAADGPDDAALALMEPGGTTHVSVIAGGVACAITSSNGEGCGWAVPGTGALANNFMGEADLHPRGFHSRPAGERLSSMMCPAIVLRDGAPALAVGTGGSNRIRTALLQVFVQHLIRGLPIQRAVEAPRLHYEAGTLYIERRGFAGSFADSTLDALRTRVPRLVLFEQPNLFFGGVHAAAADGGGAGDPRRGGVVLTVR